MLATAVTSEESGPIQAIGRRDLVIRICGEAGEGILSTGQLLAQAAARSGLKVLTYFSPPAEIKGGYSWFQLRLSDGEIHTPGDSPDVLVAFNQDAADRDVPDLRPGGLLLHDASLLTVPVGRFRSVPLPLTAIARDRLRFELGKNVVALGAVGSLCGIRPEHAARLLRERFGHKGEDVLAKNLAALEAGGAWIRDNLPLARDLAIKPASQSPGDLVISGNQAIALGALAAGLRFFAGYPITPASEVMEVLASQLPRVGGACVQAEDEIAALGMVLGAAFAGDRSLTATSGPGLSLMVELLGLATMAELPAVVVDVQRAGPSTGMPTRHEQGDLALAAFGGHGEVARLVLAPTSVADCFYQTFNALNYAERYQLPVVVLSDQALAVRTENVPRPDLESLEIWPRVPFEVGEDGAATDYRRYALGAPNGVSPMSVPGQRGGEYTATGLEHNEHGRPRYDAATHESMTERRLAKLAAVAKHAPPPLRHGDPAAPIGVIAWGSTAGPAIEAIDAARARGVNAELLVPRLLRPLPDDQIAPFLAGKQVIVVPEANVGGQFADMLVARYRREVRRVSNHGGAPFRSDDLVAALVAAEDERQSRTAHGVSNGASNGGSNGGR